MFSSNKIFSVECKHGAGFTPIVFEKTTLTTFIVKVAMCLTCGMAKQLNLPVVPVPSKNGDAPTVE